MTTTTKSTTCFGKGGAPLSVFYSPSQARESARYEKERRGHDLEEYKCRDCGRWHLSAPRKPKQNTCGCTSRYGELKDRYACRQEAERARESAYRKRGAHLYVYPCPHGHGWHLSGIASGY